MGITKSSTDDEIEKITHRIMMELETASSKDLSDVHYAKKILQLSDLHYTNRILQEIESVSSGAEGVIEKRAVVKVLDLLRNKDKYALCISVVSKLTKIIAAY